MSRERGAGSGTPRCASSRRAARASHVVRQRLATIRGATRMATRRVGQPSAVTASARPAAVPPVPSGRTIASGGEAICAASSNPASKWPTTARGCAPPPGIQRRGPSAPARRHAVSTASGTNPLVRACTTRAALARHAEATARLAGVSGCGNCASTARPAAAAACTAVARQWVEPVPPRVTKTVPGRAPASRNSSARTLFPP